MRARTLVAGLALGRVAIGAALLARPEAAGGPGWIGAKEARRPAASLLLRAVGARDMALGLGMLATLRQGGPLRPWLLGASFADGTDLAATFAAGSAIPSQARAGIAVLAGGAIASQLPLARKLG